MLKFVTRRAWIDLVARVEKLEAAVLEQVVPLSLTRGVRSLVPGRGFWRLSLKGSKEVYDVLLFRRA